MRNVLAFPFVLTVIVVSSAAPRVAQAQDPEMACLSRCPRVPDLMGSTKPDPACVRKCLMSGTASPIRFTTSWDATPVRQLNKAVIEDLVGNFDSSDAGLAEFLKDWMIENVTFNRVSTRSSPLIRVPEMRAGLDKLEFEDRFFTATDARRMNLLTFELAKVIWIRLDESERGNAIRRLVASHGGLFLELKHARHGGENLSDIADGGDAPSTFAYAVRAIVLDLQPASPQRAADWKKVKAQLESAIRGYLAAKIE